MLWASMAGRHGGLPLHVAYLAPSSFGEGWGGAPGVFLYTWLFRLPPLFSNLITS